MCHELLQGLQTPCAWLCGLCAARLLLAAKAASSTCSAAGVL